MQNGLGQFGLIGAGPVHEYLIGDLPRVIRAVGPVAAVNRRTASRIVNTLRAGEACDLDEIGSVPVILICAPGDHLQPLLTALERSKVDWTGKSIVLCECVAFSRELEFLRAAGASVASLRPFVGMPRRVLIEGDRSALRAARYLVQQMNSVAMEIRAEDYLFYSAALTISSSLFTPLLESCMVAIRQTRLSGTHSGQIVEALFLQTLRTFLYSGRKSWSGIVAEGNQKAMDLEMAALETIQPEIADLYRSSAASAICLLSPRRPSGKAPESS
jgi:predicted short-subunit dehydrogenase-like oxidoreductase (DUF2520 family)